MHRILFILWIVQAVSDRTTANAVVQVLNAASGASTVTLQTQNSETRGASAVETTRTLSGATVIESAQTNNSATESEPPNDSPLQTQNDATERGPSTIQAQNNTTERRLSNTAMLRTQNDTTGRGLRDMIRNLAHRLGKLEDLRTLYASRYSTLKNGFKALSRSTDTLTSQINNHISTVVAFHASWLDSTPTLSAQVLKYLNVLLNVGNAYSNDTGKFTAPRAGLYYFTATSAPGAMSTSTTFDLVVDSMGSAELFSLGYNTPYREYYSQSTIQGIVHLSEGQQVWVKASHPGDVYNSDYCTFSGFLLTLDV